MKLTIFLLLFAAIQVMGLESYSQETTLTLNLKSVSLKKVLASIEENSEYYFLYSSKIIDVERKMDAINIKEKNIFLVLDEILKDTNIEYVVKGRQILLSSKHLQNGNFEFSQQQKVVSGKVTNSSGGPIPGVTIIVKGTTQGAVTDSEGNYSLSNIPANATLVFSFVGMKSQEIAVSGKQKVNVVLEEETFNLDEVVAIGYGTRKKSDLTGSVGEVNNKIFRDLPSSTIDQKLVGQTAGVYIQNMSGTPGGGTAVQIRGTGSVGAGNQPLYVIDDFPYAADMDYRTNPLLFINPNDIESISILKDASSTAIYGSRGANGVILITTKKGRFEHEEVNVSSTIGINQVPQKSRPEMLNAEENAELIRDRIYKIIMHKENRQGTLDDIPELYRPQNITDPKGTVWYDEILRPALVQNHNISMMKGTKNSRFNVSFGYYNEDGTIKFTGLERFSGSISVESKIGRVINVGASLNPTFVNQTLANTGSSRTDVIGISLWANPLISPYDENGGLVPYIQSPKNEYQTIWSAVNPLFYLKETPEREKSFQNRGSAFVEWEIIPDLKAKYRINTVWSSREYDQYIPSYVGGVNRPPTLGGGQSYNERGGGINWLNECLVTYDKLFKERHHIDAVVGYTAQKSTSKNITINANPYDNDLIRTINAAQAITSWGQSVNEWSIISYLARANYSYGNKYLFTATFRADGSSRFGEKNRYAFFPSVAGAWRISEEPFFNVKEVNSFKLRLSYGRGGNNNIGNYQHVADINGNTYVLGGKDVTANTIGLGNPFLTWEESEQIDAGFDLGLFGDKFHLEADFYHKKSKDMLINNQISGITGFTSQTMNIGNIRNNGIEISLDGNIGSGSFNWTPKINFSLNRNKVLALNEDNDPIYSGSNDGKPTHITEVGQPMTQFFGFIFDGLWTAEKLDEAGLGLIDANDCYPGGPNFRDLDGSGLPTDVVDYTTIGNPFPDFRFGITNRFSYKNIDLSVVLNGQYGGQVVNGLRQTVDNIKGYFNVAKYFKDRWRSPENPGDGIHYGVPPVSGRGHRMSTLWIEDATFLRVRNVTIGYSLPKRMLESFSLIKDFRVYLTIDNAAIFTKYGGANPEAQAMSRDITMAPGYDISNYPLSRNVSMGVNVIF